MMYARLGWINQPMKMRETSRVQDKKLAVNNNHHIDIGGLQYIDSFKEDDNEVLTCFVNPGDILSFQSEGQAIRTDALMPNNVMMDGVALKGLYHSSEYAKVSDERLVEIIKDATLKNIGVGEEFIEMQNIISEELIVEKEFGEKQDEGSDFDLELPKY